MTTSDLPTAATPPPSTNDNTNNNEDWCECCHRLCTDADRAKFANRFSTLKRRREGEWSALEVLGRLKNTPPGTFPFTSLPSTLCKKIYNVLIEPKQAERGAYVTHDHIFPTQILYLNRAVRDEFLDELMDRVFVICQYSTHPKHVEVQLPPPTLFRRVKRIFFRLIVSDTHGTVVPTWSQVFRDTSSLLSMFPALVGTSICFRGVYVDNKTLDETDVVKTWEESELRRTDQAKRVTFEFEGPRVWDGEFKVQRVDAYTYQRTNVEVAGSEWREWKKSSTKPVW